VGIDGSTKFSGGDRPALVGLATYVVALTGMRRPARCPMGWPKVIQARRSVGCPAFARGHPPGGRPDFRGCRSTAGSRAVKPASRLMPGTCIRDCGSILQ